MLKIDIDSIGEKIIGPVYESKKYKNAEKKFYEVLETSEEKVKLPIEAAAHLMETAAVHLTLEKAFKEGMRFILDTMAGKVAFDFSGIIGADEDENTESAVNKIIVDIETSLKKAHASLIELEEVIEI